MFYIQGEVISDQCYHLKFIRFGDSVVHFGKKTRSFGNVFEGGPLFPKVNVKILAKI